jgi:hypothetical protein
MLNEQFQALAEAHLMDEGSTMRIIKLGRRGQLAEQGTAHIIQESIEMRERYHTELESAVRQVHEQVQSEHAAAQLREACIQYVNEREAAGKEEMEALTLKLASNSEELTMNNETVMEHRRQAVAARDERMAEMQNAISKLAESLAWKDEVVEQRGARIKEQSKRITHPNEASHRSMLSSLDMDNIKFELKQMEEVTAAEIAEKDYKLERAERDIAERKESAYVARDER